MTAPYTMTSLEKGVVGGLKAIRIKYGLLERLHIRKNGKSDKRRWHDPFIQRLSARVLRPSKVRGKAGTSKCKNRGSNSPVGNHSLATLLTIYLIHVLTTQQ